LSAEPETARQEAAPAPQHFARLGGFARFAAQSRASRKRRTDGARLIAATSDSISSRVSPP